MAITIDTNSTIPIFTQLHDGIVAAIATGEISPGDKLGSVRAVALEFGINPATVKKAYDQLQDEGIVVTSPRGGTIVAAQADPTQHAAYHQQLRATLAKGIAAGLDAQTLLNHCGDIIGEFTEIRQGARP